MSAEQVRVGLPSQERVPQYSQAPDRVPLVAPPQKVFALYTFTTDRRVVKSDGDNDHNKDNRYRTRYEYFYNPHTVLLTKDSDQYRIYSAPRMSYAQIPPRPSVPQSPLMKAPKVESVEMRQNCQPSSERIMVTFKGQQFKLERSTRSTFRKDENDSFTYDPGARFRWPFEGRPPEDLPKSVIYAELFKSLESGGPRNFEFLPHKSPIMKKINGTDFVQLKDSDDGSVELQALVYFDDYDKSDEAYGVWHRGYDDKIESLAFVSAHWVPGIGVLYDVHKGTPFEVRQRINAARETLGVPDIHQVVADAYSHFRKMREGNVVQFPAVPGVAAAA